LLAQLDPQDLKLSQEAARAAWAAAQVNQAQAEADFRRFKELRDQGFISSAEFERRETTLKSARAQAEQAAAQAGAHRNQAAYATLEADAAGVVPAVEAEPGMVVAAGTPVLKLAHDGPRDAVFSVPENKIELVRALAGKPGALRVRQWSNGQQTLPATVREIAAAADPTTRTFLVKADIGASPMRLGQTATVLLDAPRQAGIVKVPLAAVTEAQGRTVVWLLDAPTMTVQPQPVQVSGAEGNLVVVAAGLSAGQTVVTAGVHALQPGQKVKRYIEPGSATVASQ
jgi:RND family efflux transporter MFP subunit